MKNISGISYLVGAICYILFLFVMFSKGSSFIFAIGTYPFLYLFPELRDPNVGLGGLPILLFGGLIGTFMFSITMYYAARILKVPLSFSKIIIGFLGLSIVLNLLNLLFNFV